MEASSPQLVPPAPFLSIIFVYVEDGKETSRFTAYCPAIPREGELLRPQAGNKQVIVHSVLHCVDQMPGYGPGLVPIVFLRPLTDDEEQKYLIAKKT